MRQPNRLFRQAWQCVLLATALFACLSVAHADNLLIKSDRLFDGRILHRNQAVLIENDHIKAVGDYEQLRPQALQIIDLGDATLLPGLIDLHSHILFQHIPQTVILEHGITTARDLGGPLQTETVQPGHLRLLTAGPILTAPGGYPLNVFGHAHHHAQGGHGTDIAIALDNAQQATHTVEHLIAQGSHVIKVALEPGGERGAPWNQHGHHQAQWPMLSATLLNTITQVAHQSGKRVSAHLSENSGVKLALAAGIDEWAHMPCSKIDDVLLRQAVKQGVTVIGTLDTLSHCEGILDNARRFAAWGGRILYGAEIAHGDIPWGFDSQELQLMIDVTGMEVVEALSRVTAQAGEYVGQAPLGQLVADAPADLIAVRGDAVARLKALEYPELVIAGGKIVKNNFTQSVEPVTNPSNEDK